MPQERTWIVGWNRKPLTKAFEESNTTWGTAMLNRFKFVFFAVTAGLCLSASPCLAQQVPPQVSKAGQTLPKTQHPWWKKAVIYEIYPRTFQTSTGDGAFDITGIASRL